MRPEMMRVFDHLREQNILDLEHAKRAGKKIVGMYCACSPQDLVIAAGAIPVGLCGTSNTPVAAAEKVLPRNLCPLIKSSYGFAITDTCPYFRFSDFLVADTTCDGKKKMFELLSRIKPMHILHLPQGTDRPGALNWWTEENRRLKEELEEFLGVTIDDDSLRAALKLCNRERRALKRLHDMNRIDPAPLSGLDLMTATWLRSFSADKAEGVEMLEQLIDEVQEIADKGLSPFQPGTPRILLTGCPVGAGSEKVLKLLEECGGSVVSLENCSGIKPLVHLVDEDEARDPLEAIAERHLNISCSCMTPNDGRLELISQLIEEFQIDGVVDLTWQACHTYNVEAELVRQLVTEEYGLPYLQLETDYSTSDVEQLKTRAAAFIEMMDRS
ncbi:MAG: 2-hydroxyacyl-CoA dehydratase [Peptococcaceae bacterium]|nr:2-hydroxyacyl-CoA dehydratase [Peptococcaceae bacterium]